ncbi:hypothetical protein OG21DRAFT_904431 [Imleria badia]|nr:hypothetical protein OG21DRAFT_904431 [Imleria badia]
MPRSQLGSTAPGGLKRQLSPIAQESTHPSKKTSRPPAKRAKPASAAPQPTRITQNVTPSMPTSPAKVATPSDLTTESGEKIQPGIQSTIVPQPSVPQESFSGNFDLYGMRLPFLAKVYLPQGATTPNYSALYDKILTFQAKPDYSARCFLAPHDTSSAPPHGRFEDVTMADPFSEEPFDITLEDITYKESLTFTSTERLSFHAPEHSTPGPGLVRDTRLSSESDCGIQSAEGVFKIKRVWATEEDGAVKELFEGFFSFNVSYSGLYRRKGHGNGEKYEFAFWGVRAMKDSTGKEIGLGPTELTW